MPVLAAAAPLYREPAPAVLPEAVLTVEDLTLGLGSGRKLVDTVSFTLRRGRLLALVGESGSGKSLTALSLLGLLPDPPVRIQSGAIRFAGQDLATLDPAGWRRIRGAGIAMIFQEPLSALNPVMTIGRQIGEAVRLHTGLTGRPAEKRVLELLDLVRMPDAARRARDYPHRLSGGMRQRVLIAMAMAGRPKILIADEPTTALDVTVQADILDTIADLRAEFGLAVLLISHDLGLVADHADEVAVMYAGRIVEQGRSDMVLDWPAHPYTRGLLGARPTGGQGPLRQRGWPRLAEIGGQAPGADAVLSGCSFAPRCLAATAACRSAQPDLRELARGHRVACIRVGAFE